MKNIFTWMRKHAFLSIGTFLLIVFGSYYFFFRESAVATPAVVTKQIEATRGSLKLTVSGSGQIEANSQVDLKSVRAGDGVDIVSVPVKNDQAVKKGQIIAVLDSGDVARSVAQSRLSLTSAEIKLKQTEDTYDTQTDDDRRTRQLQEIAVSQSRISLEDAEETLSDYTIRAPFDGIVTGLSVEAGDSLSNDTVLASVITKEMKATITLNEVDAAKVKVGDTAQLSFNAFSDVVLSGKISKLDTIGKASQGVVSYGAEITLDEQNELLKPGMSATAEITVEEKNNIVLVPNSALSYEGEKASVTLATGQKKEVKTGITDNTSTEIVSGLSDKEKIVIATTGMAQSSVKQSQGGILSSLLRGGRAR